MDMATILAYCLATHGGCGSANIPDAVRASDYRRFVEYEKCYKTTFRSIPNGPDGYPYPEYMLRSSTEETCAKRLHANLKVTTDSPGLTPIILLSR